MSRLLQLWNTWKCWELQACRSPGVILAPMSNLGTLNANQNWSSRRQETCLGREHREAAQQNQPHAHNPSLQLLSSASTITAASVPLRATKHVCQPPLQTSWIRDGTPPPHPDPSLQELMPFVWPDWMLCQSLPPSKPPMLGRHSCEPLQAETEAPVVLPAQALPLSLLSSHCSSYISSPAAFI